MNKKSKITPVQPKVPITSNFMQLPDTHPMIQFINYSKEYCKATTIHGFSYVVEAKRHLAEKIFWMTTIIISMIACAILIAETLRSSELNPISIAMIETPWKIENILHPAITICPDFDNVVGGGEKFNETLICYLIEITNFNLIISRYEYILAAAMICDKLFVTNLIYYYLTETPTNAMIEIMRNHSRAKWFQKQYASWNGYDVTFSEILTSSGFCFTFNLAKAEEILNIESVADEFIYNSSALTLKGSKRQETKETQKPYLWNAKAIKKDEGLTIILKDKRKHIDMICFNSNYQIFIHHPMTYPVNVRNFLDHKEYIDLGRDKDIIIKPKLLVTDEKLRAYSPERRNCYFEGEKVLKFFKSYSYSNCLADCEARVTLDLCGCAFFANLRKFYQSVFGVNLNSIFKGDQYVPICGYRNMDCFNKVMSVFEDTTDSKTVADCKCLPSCYLLEYDFDVVESSIKRNHTNQENEEGSLNIYFDESEFIALKRFQSYVFIELIANFGGLLGIMRANGYVYG
ncbi:unnamed protein product [Diamesa hyperborea]